MRSAEHVHVQLQILDPLPFLCFDLAIQLHFVEEFQILAYLLLGYILRIGYLKVDVSRWLIGLFLLIVLTAATLHMS